MPRVGFEHTIPVFERAKTVHAVTVIGTHHLYTNIFRVATNLLFYIFIEHCPKIDYDMKV
jgi:hypothetical protein